MKRKTLMQLAYDQLKEGILDGSISNERTYTTQYFADFLNISKTPCREALQKLENEGLVELNQAQGVIIKGLSMQRLLDVMQFRSSIDSYCAYYMAEHADEPDTKETIVVLKELCEKQQRLLESGADDNRELSAEWYDLDNTFHMRMCEHTGNKRIIGQRKDIEGYTRYIGVVTANVENRKQESINENLELLDVIEKRQPHDAFRVARMHAEKIYRLMLQSDRLTR